MNTNQTPAAGTVAGLSVAPGSACCDRPAVVVMDYTAEGARKVNRVCTHCWTHWFGATTAVRQYTKKEWDDYINGPET